MKIEKILQLDNIAEELENTDLQDIGKDVVRDYDTDKGSRSEWEKQYENANKLALQMVEPKSSPWPGAANVKFPLITVGALQFNARAYPFVMNNGDVVKCKVIGADPQGLKAAQASRKSQHMNWQLAHEDEDWEEGVDRLTMVLPISGTCFKKTYFNEHNESDLVLAPDLIVNYWAKTLHGTRKTQRLYFTQREIREKQLAGDWLDIDIPKSQEQKDTIKQGEDKRAGKSDPGPDDDASTELFLEQYTYLDLDDDEYTEPYIVTTHYGSGKVVRIVANFSGVQRKNDGKIAALAQQAQEVYSADSDPDLKTDVLEDIEAEITALSRDNPISRIVEDEYFTAYHFMPNPDGSSIYGLGFGALLGPVNRAVSTLLNQLIDSGSLANSNSGFIGRAAKMTQGAIRLKPFEWKNIPIAGGTLRENLVPVPANDPSDVLFRLLVVLIEYGERISSAKDMVTGDTPGQNTPATTAITSLEQGLKVFNGIFKRIHRSLREEIRKLYRLNYLYLDETTYFSVLDEDKKVLQSDYAGDPKDVSPAADPSTITSGEKLIKAQFLAERADMYPGGYNRAAIERRLLEAAGVPDAQEIFPLDKEGNPTIPAPQDPKLELEAAEEERRTAESKVRSATQWITAEAKVASELAKTLLLRAQAEKTVSDAELEATDRVIKILELKLEEINANKGAETEGGG